MKGFKVIGVAMVVTVVALLAWNRLSRDSSQRVVRLEQRQTQATTETHSGISVSQDSDRKSEEHPITERLALNSNGPGEGSGSNVPNATPQTKAAANKAKAPRAPKEPLKDPLARAALASVGFDPAAEEYWLGAINDPNLSGHERQDLIEDLNEEGFADPKNLTPEDLPLILSRIELIEQLGPFAMDQVNDDAFQEAYKDLLNMANKVLGVSTPKL